MEKESIETFGKWTLRIILVIAAIVTAVNGNDGVSQGCLFGLFLSFLFL